MGMIFGRIAEEQPRYETIFESAAKSFQIRHYPPILVVETAYGADSGVEKSGGEFMRLARYIGVFSKPENSAAGTEEPEPIAMTAPVFMSHPVKMPSDSAEHDAARKMAFVLPNSKYTTLAQVPQPTDPRVSVREVGARHMAVRTFSGNLEDAWTAENLKLLLDDFASDAEVQKQGWQVCRGAGDAALPTSPNWYLAGYNAPFVPRWFKTNEILVEIAKGSS